MAETTLQIQPRETGGSPTARAVRRQGLVPGILYGRGREPYPFQIDVPTLREALSGEAGRHAILQVSVPGESSPTPAILKDFQLDLVRDRLTHLDLLAISMTEKITTTVAVHVEGEAPGVVDDGGVLEQPVHEIEVSALPGDVPNVITVDVSSLGTGDTIKLGDITPPSGVEWATDPETVLATILQPTTMEDIEAEAAEGEAAAEGEEPAEGEAAGGRRRRRVRLRVAPPGHARGTPAPLRRRLAGRAGRRPGQSRPAVRAHAAQPRLPRRSTLLCERSRGELPQQVQRPLRRGAARRGAVALLGPETYMNLSGPPVANAARFFKVEPAQVIAVYDDIEVDFDRIRAKLGGGLQGHNGLRSMADALGTRDFLRVRLGVGRPRRGDPREHRRLRAGAVRGRRGPRLAGRARRRRRAAAPRRGRRGGREAVPLGASGGAGVRTLAPAAAARAPAVPERAVLRALAPGVLALPDLAFLVLELPLRPGLSPARPDRT